MSANSPRKTRVLFLLKDLSFGGAERVCLNLARSLPAAQFSSTLFVCGNTLDMKAEIPVGVDVLLGMDSHLRFRETFVPLLKKLRNIVDAFDVVVATSPDTTALMQLSGASKHVRRITWVHFDAEGFLPNTNRLIRLVAKGVYPRTANRVFISNNSRNSFVNAFGAKEGDVVIPNIFDPAIYGGSSSTEESVLAVKAHGLPVYGFVGRLVPGKGLEKLVEIHQRLLARGHAHHLVAIGDGPLAAPLRKTIQEQRLDGFHLLGPDASPLNAMRHFDSLFLTSEFEAWPTVMLEAFHAQVRVVAFDCPSGPREMMTGPLSKGLVPFGDVDAFCAAVQVIENDGSSLISAGLQRIQSFYPGAAVKPWLPLLRG